MKANEDSSWKIVSEIDLVQNWKLIRSMWAEKINFLKLIYLEHNMVFRKKDSFQRLIFEKSKF